MAKSGFWSAPLTTKEPLRVDPDRLFAAALLMAEVMGPNPVLFRIQFSGVINEDGTFPLTISDSPPIRQRLDFEFSTKLVASRPGANEKERIHIFLNDGDLMGGRDSVVPEDKDWEVPCCPIRRVFRSIIASGVPKEAILDVEYRASSRDRAPYWYAYVRNHPEYARMIEGRTCDLIDKLK